MRQLLIRLAIVVIVAALTAFMATWFYFRRTMEQTSGRGRIRVYLFPLGWVVVALAALAGLAVAYWIVSPAIRSR